MTTKKTVVNNHHPKSDEHKPHAKKDQSIESKLIDELKKQIEKLQWEKNKAEERIKELEETAKRAQYDYVNLKMDFDRYRTKHDESKDEQKLELLLDTVKKFLPFVENVRKSLDNITEEVKTSPLGQWVSMVYEKFLNTLEQMHIKPIESIGQEPDNVLHEPVSAQPVQDKKLKGKIVQEFERWFVYHKGDTKKVVTTSKVVVGQ